MTKEATDLVELLTIWCGGTTHVYNLKDFEYRENTFGQLSIYRKPNGQLVAKFSGTWHFTRTVYNASESL